MGSGVGRADVRPSRISVGGVERTFLVAPAPEPESPLLMVLHGTGTTGKGMAAFTGLARRGPLAGFATVFPDGLGEVWDRGRQLAGREGVSDTAFLQALVGRLVADGVARPGALWLVGMSNGAFFVEHLARRGLLAVRGIGLVAGAQTRDSRDAASPTQAAAVACFQGTADPVVPYEGGPIGTRGPFGRKISRLAAERGEEGDARVAVAAEEVARDWALANASGDPAAPGGPAVPGLAVPGSAVPGPVISQLAMAEGGLPVRRLEWAPQGRPPVVVYRIEGGGHAWPGGPQYLPVEAIGPVARGLDATGILLEMAGAEVLSRDL